MSEEDVHKSIIDWLRYSLPEGSVFHHSPNEGRHQVQYRMKQKRLGVQFGWPDLEIFCNPTWWCGEKPWAPVFLEIKAEKGRLSENQKDVLEKLDKAGCYTTVVRSIDEARSFLSKLMRLKDVS